MLRTFLLAFFFISSTQACELTEEYKNIRAKHVKESKLAYEMCTSAISSAEFWYRNVQCIKAGDNNNHSGGCGHLAGIPNEKYESIGVGPDVCESLKPSTTEMKRWLSDFVAKAGIEKCKKHNKSINVAPTGLDLHSAAPPLRSGPLLRR